jgi:hypothetical protein
VSSVAKKEKRDRTRKEMLIMPVIQRKGNAYETGSPVIRSEKLKRSVRKQF